MSNITIEYNLLDEFDLMDNLEKSLKAIKNNVVRYKPFPDKVMQDIEDHATGFFKKSLDLMMKDVQEIILDEGEEI